MFYKPEKVKEMWDTWLYYHEGTHYLFYLHKSSGKIWDGLSLATSTDGIHYKEIGPIIEKSDDALWLGTGSTWKAGNDFILNYSESRDGVQNIFFAKSKDLINWQKLGDEYRFSPDPKWYDDTKDGRWDCIWTIPKREGGYFGYLSARPWKCPLGDSVGMVESSDGINWKAIPPPEFDWGDWPENSLGEVGAIEKIGDYYYLLLNHIEYNTSDNIQENKLSTRLGMHVFISDSPRGPFRPQKKAYRLLTGPRMMGYFTRFYKTDKEMLLCHHWIENHSGKDIIWMAPLKKAIIDKNECLRMGYWVGNEKAKGKEISIDLALSERIYPPRVGQNAVATRDSYIAEELHGGRVILLKRNFDIQKGIILEGSMKIESINKHCGGIGIFIEEEKEKLQGTAIVARTEGKTEIGPLKVSFIHDQSYLGLSSFNPDDIVEGSIIADKDNAFRLILRGAMVEFYIDDVLIQCHSLPVMPTGRIGLVFESGRVCFKNFKMWEMNIA